ncbi:MAG: hypothetical protein IKD75_10020 [Prevotella sp.]|nr:hypothetical protein [Prevotella sp.]
MVSYKDGVITYSYDVEGLKDVKIDGERFNTVRGNGTATYTYELTPGKHVLTIGDVDYEFEVEDPNAEPVVEPIANVYGVDLTNVTYADSRTNGTGAVILIKGNQPVENVYARITWTYDIGNDNQFSYCVVRELNITEDAITFSTRGAQTPYNTTLKTIGVALVNDIDADSVGAYWDLVVNEEAEKDLAISNKQF